MPAPPPLGFEEWPTLEEEQLETPPASAISNTTSQSAFCRRQRASGTSASPQASENGCQPKGRASRVDDVDCPVAIVTVS